VNLLHSLSNHYAVGVIELQLISVRGAQAPATVCRDAFPSAWRARKFDCTTQQDANKKAPGLGAFLIEVIGRCGQSA
jgi:hypothetical protein